MTSPEHRIEQQIYIPIAFGERTTSFHRDPEMEMHEGGEIFIDWQGKESPDATYYIVVTEGRVGWGPHELHLLDNLKDLWKKGEIENPEIDDGYTKVSPRWTQKFDPRSGALEIPGKGPGGIGYFLLIKAQPFQTIHAPQE